MLNVKVTSNSFSESLMGEIRIGSAKDDSMGENEATAIQAKRLRGNICDIDLESNDEFN